MELILERQEDEKMQKHIKATIFEEKCCDGLFKWNWEVANTVRR